VLLGDVDNDNDLDAITFSGASVVGEVVRLWRNQGGTQGGTEGVFNADQTVARGTNRRGALGDIDGDGDLDLLVPLVAEGIQVWHNQGGAQGGTIGTFVDSGVRLGNPDTAYQAALGDLDGDGDLDALYASFEETIVARNEGGSFSNSAPLPIGANRLVLADFDGDSDLDVLLNNEDVSLLLNQGTNTGTFAASEQRIENLRGKPVTVGDVDGDGDPDLIATVDIHQARIFLNQGGQQGGTPATFVQDNQQITVGGSIPPRAIVAGDLDNDNDIDLLVGGTRDTLALTVWQNDGTGLFTAGETYRGLGTYDSALGDLDGDNDLDAFVIGAGPHRILLNGETGIPPVLRFGVASLQGSERENFRIWWSGGNARLSLILSHPVPDPVALQVDLTSSDDGTDTDTLQFTASETRAFITGYERKEGGASGYIRNPYQLDPADFPDGDQSTISSTINLASLNAADVTLRGPETVAIIFPRPEIDSIGLCFLEGIQLLLRLVTGSGLTTLAQEEIDLALYARLRDDIMVQSEAGRYYTEVYADSSLDLLQVAGQHTSVISQSVDTLAMWQPALQALVDGEGDTVTITPEMVESMQVALDDYKTFGSSNLAGTIASAEAIVDLDSYVGLTMDEALARFETIQIERTYLPLVVR
jgi:hypothetical protein